MTVVQYLLPEMNQELLDRIKILRTLRATGERIGRQALASRLGLSERSVRTSVEHLRLADLIEVNAAGMKLTEFGQTVTQYCDRLLNDDHPYYELEQRLKDQLDIRHCRIVDGSESDHSLDSALAAAVQRMMCEHLGSGDRVIAVTGGSTLARLAAHFSPELTAQGAVTFVPTRGGLGTALAIQSNTIASVMAKSSQGDYVPLFTPELMTEETREALMQVEAIRSVVDLGRQADCLLLSVGVADVMAERREITPDQEARLIEAGAVGEVLGSFFDRQGQVIAQYPRIGLTLADLPQMPLILTVANGAYKAEAVASFFRLAPAQTCLVCDVALAEALIELASQDA